MKAKGDHDVEDADHHQCHNWLGGCGRGCRFAASTTAASTAGRGQGTHWETSDHRQAPRQASGAGGSGCDNERLSTESQFFAWPINIRGGAVSHVIPWPPLPLLALGL